MRFFGIIHGNKVYSVIKYNGFALIRTYNKKLKFFVEGSNSHFPIAECIVSNSKDRESRLAFVY